MGGSNDLLPLEYSSYAGLRSRVEGSGRPSQLNRATPGPTARAPHPPPLLDGIVAPRPRSPRISGHPLRHPEDWTWNEAADNPLARPGDR